MARLGDGHYYFSDGSLYCFTGEKFEQVGEEFNMTEQEAKHLFSLTSAMRQAQKLYFKQPRTKDNLIAAKRLETALDKFLAEIAPTWED